MDRPRLRFYCRGTAQVTDFPAAERGVRRCVGRRWQEVLPGTFAWVPSGKPQEVDYHHDLVKACFDGDLWPADEATAKTCKVGFDPLFGEEPTQTIREFRAASEPAKAEAPAPKAEEPAKATKTEHPAKSGGKAEV